MRLSWNEIRVRLRALLKSGKTPITKRAKRNLFIMISLTSLVLNAAKLAAMKKPSKT